MSDVKWTKGPWVANSKTPMAAAVCKVGPSEIGTDSDLGDDYADAHLIAAAPELAEYVRMMAETGDDRAKKLWEKCNGNH